MYYMAGLLQHAAQWCADEVNGEKLLLAGLVDGVDLPRYLMQGTRGSADGPGS